MFENDYKCSKCLVNTYTKSKLFDIKHTVYSSTHFKIKHRAWIWTMFNILVNDETESVKTIHSSALSWLQTVRLAWIKGCFVGTLNIFIRNNKFALILEITRSGPYCQQQRQYKSPHLKLTIGKLNMLNSLKVDIFFQCYSNHTYHGLWKRE